MKTKYLRMANEQILALLNRFNTGNQVFSIGGPLILPTSRPHYHRNGFIGL